MGQVSGKKKNTLGHPSGRPGCNLNDYIKEKDPYKKGDQEKKVEGESESIVVKEQVLTYTSA